MKVYFYTETTRKSKITSLDRIFKIVKFLSFNYYLVFIPVGIPL